MNRQDGEGRRDPGQRRTPLCTDRGSSGTVWVYPDRHHRKKLKGVRGLVGVEEAPRVDQTEVPVHAPDLYRWEFDLRQGSTEGRGTESE